MSRNLLCIFPGPRSPKYVAPELLMKILGSRPGFSSKFHRKPTNKTLGTKKNVEQKPFPRPPLPKPRPSPLPLAVAPAPAPACASTPVSAPAHARCSHNQPPHTILFVVRCFCFHHRPRSRRLLHLPPATSVALICTKKAASLTKVITFTTGNEHLRVFSQRVHVAFDLNKESSLAHEGLHSSKLLYDVVA